MARSLAVPHVPSSSVKVAVPSDVMARVDAMAENAGLSRDDCVELGLRALLDGDGSPAAVVWSRYTSGHVQTPGDVISALSEANVPDAVRGFRLGSPAVDRTPVPWPQRSGGRSGCRRWTLAHSSWSVAHAPSGYLGDRRAAAGPCPRRLPGCRVAAGARIRSALRDWRTGDRPSRPAAGRGKRRRYRIGNGG